MVHVAGRADRRPFGELDVAGFDEAIAVNARAFLNLATTALPHLCASPAAGYITGQCLHVDGGLTLWQAALCR